MMKPLLAIAFCLALAASAARADTPANWTRLCASCHGKDGAGHTKAGRMVKAKDLTDSAYQKSFTDDAAVKSLTDGLKDADGNTKMKPFSDKLSPDEAKALIAYVRTLAK